jgi:predicted PurR-regulated permease PerM
MFFILRPFISPLFLAFALAVIFKPVHRFYIKKLKDRPAMAALAATITIGIIILIPLLFVGSLLFTEVRNIYIAVPTDRSFTVVLDELSQKVEEPLRNLFPTASFSIREYITTGLSWIFSHLNTFFSSLVGVMIDLFIMILALYFILREGSALRKKYISLSPLADQDDELILSSVIRAISSVARGALLVGIIQGALAGIGFAIVGVPSPILWGTAAALSSLIPGIGTALVTIPGILYLLFTGHTIQAIILITWSVLIIGLVDNFLGPYLVRRGLNIHHFLILLSVLGGLAFFGPIGFIAGPIVLSVFFELIALYPKVTGAKQK